MTFVYFAVEGDADVPVAERLIRHVGHTPHRAIVAGGVPRLDQRIPGLTRSAAHMNWLILRDLDREQCAPRLVRRLFAGGIPPRASLRIPVRSMESWMLADAVGFSEVFSVNQNRLPDRPDNLENAKLYLVNACRSSRRLEVRSAIPATKGERSHGRPGVCEPNFGLRAPSLGSRAGGGALPEPRACNSSA